MPTYTYSCERCGEFEQLQAMSDSPLESCPRCGGVVKRVIAGGSGFIVKGKGSASNCGQHSPCCGRETRCDKPPCGK